MTGGFRCHCDQSEGSVRVRIQQSLAIERYLRKIVLALLNLHCRLQQHDFKFGVGEVGEYVLNRLELLIRTLGVLHGLQRSQFLGDLGFGLVASLDGSAVKLFNGTLTSKATEKKPIIISSKV